MKVHNLVDHKSVEKIVHNIVNHCKKLYITSGGSL